MNKKKYNTRRRSESLQNLSHYFSSCSDSENDDENLKIKQNTDHHKDIFRKSVREKVRRSIITRNLNEFVSSTPLHSTRKTFNNTVFISPITEETEPVAARTTQHSTSSRPQDHNNKTKFTETKGKDNHTSKCIFPTSSTKNAHNSVLATILQSNNSSEKCTNDPEDGQFPLRSNSQKSNGRNNKSTRTNVRKTFSAHVQTSFSPRLSTISNFQNRIIQTVMDKGTQITDSLERYGSSKDKELSGVDVQNFLADEDNYSEDNDATLTNQKSSLKPKEFINKKTKKNGTLDSIRQSPGMSYLYNVHSNKEDILNNSQRLGKSGKDQSKDDVSWLSSLLSSYLKNCPSDTSSFSEKSNKNNEQGPPTKCKNKEISRNSKSNDPQRKQSIKAISNANLSEDEDILESIQPAVRSIHDIENDIDFVERNSTSVRKNTTRKRKQSADRSLKTIEKGKKTSHQKRQQTNTTGRNNNSSVYLGPSSKYKDKEISKSSNLNGSQRESIKATSKVNLSGNSLHDNQSAVTSILTTQEDVPSKNSVHDHCQLDKEVSNKKVAQSQQNNGNSVNNKGHESHAKSIVGEINEDDQGAFNHDIENDIYLMERSRSLKTKNSTRKPKQSCNRNFKAKKRETLSSALGDVINQSVLDNVNANLRPRKSISNKRSNSPFVKTYQTSAVDILENRLLNSNNLTSKDKAKGRKRRKSLTKPIPELIVTEHNEEGCGSLRRSKRKRKDRDAFYRPEIIFTRDRCLINCTKANRALQVSVNLEMAKISRRVGSSLKKQTPSTPQDSRNTHNKKKQFRKGKGNDTKILEEEESQMIIVNKDSCQKNISHDRIDKSEKETNNYEKEKTFENTNENYQENNPTEDMIAEEIDNNTEINTNTDQLNNIMDLVGTLHAKSKFQNLGSSRDYFYFPQNNAVNKIPWCFVNPSLNYIDKRKCLRVGVGPKSSLCGFKSGFLEILPGESKPRHIAVKFSLVFIVLEGRGLFQVHDSHRIVEHSAVLYVPLGAYYYIENQSKTERLRLFYLQIKPQP